MRLAATALAVVVTAAPVMAEDRWTTEATTYLWFPSTATTMATPFGNVETEISAGDAIKALDFGIMGTVTSRKGPWSLTGDFLYLDLSADAGTKFGLLFSGVEGRTRLGSLAVYGSYRVAESPDYALDLGVGLRGFSSKIDVRLQPGLLPDTRFSVEDDWVDPLVAARLTGRFSGAWSGMLAVDYGGFGIGEASDETWQVVATVGYRINELWSVAGGFRKLVVERETGGVDYEVDLSGPVLGATYRF